MTSLQAVHEQYFAALCAGEVKHAERAIEDALEAGFRVQDLYLHVIQPAQRKIGDLWAEGRLKVSEEHRASHITLTQLGRLRHIFSSARPNGLSAVICCVGREQHEIGAEMVADFLSSEGWRVEFLGGAVPVPDLLYFLKERRPALLGLSVTLADHVPDAKEAIRTIRDHSRVPVIVVGGRAFKDDGLLPLAIGADAYGRDASDAVRKALGLCQAVPAEGARISLLQAVGGRILAARKGRGLTQKELAAKAGIDRTYLSGVEQGKENISLVVLGRIADALGIPPLTLLGEG